MNTWTIYANLNSSPTKPFSLKIAFIISAQGTVVITLSNLSSNENSQFCLPNKRLKTGFTAIISILFCTDVLKMTVFIAY